MKILLLDIETAPNLAYVWGLWNQNISPNQIANSGYVLCWSAKWYDHGGLMFDSEFKSGHKKMLSSVHNLLDEADVVVHYNGKSFDIPTLNKEFLLYDFLPPAPYKQIDLLEVSRKVFRFASHKLDYVAQTLKIGAKVKHAGHQLWVDCMNHKPEAWRKMEKYNKNDVVIMGGVFDKFLPWIPNFPNRGMYDDSAFCPVCGGSKRQERGLYHARNTAYKRFQCMETNKRGGICGKWYHSARPVTKTALYRNIPA